MELMATKSAAPRARVTVPAIFSGKMSAAAVIMMKIGIGNLTVGSLCIVLQASVTIMAYIYHGLYAWNYDAPLLAKCMTGIFAGIVCLLLGYIQIDYSKEYRKFTNDHGDLDQRVCAVKLFSCFLLLFGLLLFGISVYLVAILCRWLSLPSEYDSYVRGPVAVALALNIGLALLGVCTAGLALMGLTMTPDTL